MAFLSLFFPFISFYLLKIKRLDIQKTRNVTKNVEPPIIFALFFKTTRRKTKGQRERGQSLNANRKRRRPNVLRNGANHLRRGVLFGRGVLVVLWLFRKNRGYLRNNARYYSQTPRYFRNNGGYFGIYSYSPTGAKSIRALSFHKVATLQRAGAAF